MHHVLEVVKPKPVLEDESVGVMIAVVEHMILGLFRRHVWRCTCLIFGLGTKPSRTGTHVKIDNNPDQSGLFLDSVYRGEEYKFDIYKLVKILRPPRPGGTIQM